VSTFGFLSGPALLVLPIFVYIVPAYIVVTRPAGRILALRLLALLPLVNIGIAIFFIMRSHSAVRSAGSRYQEFR